MIELIIPPNPYLQDEIRNPPLGLLYIAAVMEAARWDVRITDLRGRQPEEFNDLIGEADIYGITAVTPDYPLALRIAKIIKARGDDSWVVLGGVHATALPHAIDPEFDKVVIGEGEVAFQEVVRAFYFRPHVRKRFYRCTPIGDLDTIPYPARHLLPVETTFSRNALVVGGELAGTIITSRGCPFDCAFCASKTMWRGKVRFRSPENVIGEIEHMVQNYGVSAFRFQDDSMTLNAERLERLCDMLMPLGINWRANARVDIADLDTLCMMARAGCVNISYGIESLSQVALDKAGKKTTPDDIYAAMRNTRLAGLQSRAFFIIGLPGEPPGFADRLERFIGEVRPDAVAVSTFVPYPGSPVYYHPEQYGIRLKDVPADQLQMTLGLVEGEMDRPLTFVHDIMTEDQIIEERRRSLELVRQNERARNS